MSKILYFTRTMNTGGTEKVILQLCEIMKDQYEIIVCSCGGVYVETLKNMGIKHYTIDDIANKNLKNIITIILAIRKVIIYNDIDIIHTHHRMAAFYIRIVLMMMRKYRKKIRFIHTMHNTFKDKKILTRFAMKNAEIIAVGNKVKDNLVNFYELPREQVEVIYNGIKEFNQETNELKVINEYKKEGYFTIGNCGRLTEQKGVKYFIEALPEVLKKWPKTKIFIIGDGELFENLKQLTNNLDLEEDVFFLGYREDVQNIISQLDLIVLSSLWEGLPLIPIEAFSVGKTIVATAVDGTVEIVSDGENGLLVPPCDSSGLATAMLKLIINEKIRETYERNALNTYKEKFSLNIFSERYREYYEKEGCGNLIC